MYIYLIKSQGKKTKIFNLGERGSGVKRRHREIQDFYKIKEDCQKTGRLWKDPEFPANDSSIYFSHKAGRKYEWKRPGEMTKNPKLFVEGASRFDVKQGELGDCWFLAATANLTSNKRMFYQVVPDDQGFGDSNDYCGAFHFRFWQYGNWVDVVVDDRIPTYKGRPVYLHSRDKNEFWSALLEKAYAKLNGSYEALKSGLTAEAMEDFTGGVTEMYELKNDKRPKNLFKMMLKAYERSSLMGCSLDADPRCCEAKLSNGLVRGHAYSITRVKYVEISTSGRQDKIALIRIRNPWGNTIEWKGAWSDNSREWKLIPENEKKELGLTFDDDGEFWMSYHDFVNNFEKLEICSIEAGSLDDLDIHAGSKKWDFNMYEGSWIKGSTAGGCRNFLDTFAKNPQYQIRLVDADEDDDDDICTVVITLMQKNRRAQKKEGTESLTIGFSLYHLKHTSNLPKPLDKDFFKRNKSAGTSQYINQRSVFQRFRLPPGTYCIIPSTFEPNEIGDFVLRVISEKPNFMQENLQAVGFGKVDQKIKPRRNKLLQAPMLSQVSAVESDDVEDTTDNKLEEIFRTFAGGDEGIDCSGLQKLLNYRLNKKFSSDVCRSMIAMMETDMSGKLSLAELEVLWTELVTWKRAFSLSDKDNSGSLNVSELSGCLGSAGYNLNSAILNAIIRRYGRNDDTVLFEDFVMIAVKLKTMIEIFQEKEDEKTKRASFSIEEWLIKTMYS